MSRRSPPAEESLGWQRELRQELLHDERRVVDRMGEVVGLELEAQVAGVLVVAVLVVEPEPGHRRRHARSHVLDVHEGQRRLAQVAPEVADRQVQVPLRDCQVATRVLDRQKLLVDVYDLAEKAPGQREESGYGAAWRIGLPGVLGLGRGLQAVLVVDLPGLLVEGVEPALELQPVLLVHGETESNQNFAIDPVVRPEVDTPRVPVHPKLIVRVLQRAWETISNN